MARAKTKLINSKIENKETESIEIKIVDNDTSYPIEKPQCPKVETWPHGPLHITPTKGSETTIIGVRYASEKEYLPHINHIPINNGYEEEGKSLVVDFYSKCFVGTILIRVKDVPIPNHAHQSTKKGYFQSRKRTFQNIIQGYFIDNYHMPSSMTGQIFQKTSKSPPSFILNSAIKFFRVLSPQLDVQWGPKRINLLSPLNSTAQSVHVCSKEEMTDEKCSNLIENWDLEEPSKDHSNSIFNHHTFSDISGKNTNDSRLYRKHIFDSLSSQHKKKPVQNATFDTNKIYTFQFYQHLLDLNEYKLDILGSKWDLTKYLNGQPIKIYAGCDDDVFWSFDIWHSSLLSSCD